MMKKVMSFWGLAAAVATSAILPSLAEPIEGFDLKVASGESAAARLEARALSLVAPRVVAGTQTLVSSNGLTTTAWDTTALANGWHEVEEPDSAGELKASLLVANLPSISVEGGRLTSNATWTSNAVHWVRNKVIVPSGVTLTVAAGAVVKFGEHTGMFVEDGGTVKFNGNSSDPVVLTHFADDVYGGDSDFGATNATWNSWSLTAQSGGTISDLYTQVRYGTVGTLPTLSMPTAVTATRSAGKARVSVSFNTAPTKRAVLTWKTIDGTAKYGVDFTKNAGEAVWVSGTTVYFDIPLVNLEDVQEVRNFTIELVTVEGANANPSRLKTTVSITGGEGAAMVPTCAASEESEAIRLETREPDPKPDPVAATMSIEGGRLSSSTVWPTAATNFVLNTVVIPSGVTLTVVTNAVVYFTPNTGIKVEPGGTLRVVGSAEQPVLFTAATKGDWSLSVVEGGTFADAYALFEKTTISQHPTVTVPNGCEVSEKDGEVRVPVAVSGSRSSAFRVKWRAVDGTAKFGEDYTLASGEVEWGGTSEGTKYISIPIANDDCEEESETFIVELCDAQGVNIGGSYRCTVLIRDGTAALVPLATCVESEESEGIRLETREPDPKPDVVGSSLAIEGGRLLSNATWSPAATNFVLHTVVIPSGVTLTVVTNAVVHFAPYTGIKVEPGGKLQCIGSQEEPVVFEAENNGDYAITVVSGGTFTDTWTAFRNLNYGGFGTASLDGNLVVDADEGVMRIPVYVSGSRTTTFSVDWEGSDGTTGTIIWNNANEGKKWIELPIEGRAEGFTLRLVEGRGINVSGSAHEIAVKVYTSAVPKAVCAESAESEAVRLESRAEGTLARALVFGTEYIAADGETRAVAWDSTTVADGWQANGTLVRNDASIAIEGGRLQAPTETYTTNDTEVVVTLPVVWSNDVTHLLRNWVVVPNGVTLRIESGTVVKFAELTGFKIEAGGKLIVAGTEENPVVYTAAADDTIGGDSDLREATPNDGDYGVNIVSGGTYTDTNCAVRYTTFSNLGTATMTAKAIVALTDGIVRIPVTISTDRTTTFCVDWRTGGARSCATANGRLTWNSKNDGTKYIELPLVAGAVTNGFDTFTVELYESQGINISTTARRCNVTVYSNDCFPQGAYAASEESEAVRFETRAYDSDLEIEASESVAVEGGRLQSDTVWSNNVTHLVRQWVIVPNGVTLTIQAGTVVKFLPYTGIKVEPGGRVNANGTLTNNIIFTSVSDDTADGDTDGKDVVPTHGNYSISVISGGTFSNTETQMRYGTSGTFGSLYIEAEAVARKDDGWVKIPVRVSSASASAFSVDWVAHDGAAKFGEDYLCASGRLDWAANSTATKYIEIPLDRMAETVEGESFTVELTFTRGINLNLSKKICTVTLYDTIDAFAGGGNGFAESAWCEFAPLDASAGTRPQFAMEEVPIRYSALWAGGAPSSATVTVTDAEKNTATLVNIGESDPAEGTTTWNGADYEDGRYDLAHKIFDPDGRVALVATATFIVNRDVVEHSGRLAVDETWTADKVHVVVSTVTVPSGVTLTIAPDAIVKFMPGTSIVVEQGGLGICKGAVLTHAYDDVMGGDTFFDGAETVPEDGGYLLSGDWEDDESTQYRYSMPLKVGGTLKEENRWPGHKTYIVTNNLTLVSGASLTIEAGAVVKFNAGLSFTVNSGATLNALGTRASPVVFTSIKDDEHGGDTNGDGSASKADCGDWRYIWVYGNASLEYAQILYGGMADGSYGERGPLMTSGSGSLNMNGCLVAHSLYDGIWNWGGSIVAKNCVITDTGWATAPYRGSKNEYINCIFYGNDVGLCYWSHWSGSPVYRNCIFAECGKGWCELNSNSYGDPPSGVMVANSLFWNPPEGGAQSCGIVGSNGNIWADPRFENVENGDFRIKADSPCVDAGDGMVAPERDYYNQPRQTIQGVEPKGTPSANGAYADIGIYEVQPRYAGADIDLEVKSVMAPETLTVGELVTVSWREANIGTVDTDGKWYDKVELVSANGAVVLLGTVPVAGIPAGGEKTITESSFRVPSIAEGACTIRVTANYNRDIYEGSLTANNVGLSGDSTVSVAGVDFTEGDVARVKLLSEQQTSYRMAGLPTGGCSLLIHSATGESFGAYVAFGKIPTTYSSASAYTMLPNGDILVSIPPHSGEETAYLMLDSTSKIQNGALDVTVNEDYPAIYALSKESMPNTGNQSLTIYGVGMDEVTGVALVATDGTAISGSSVRSANACELSASFALTGAKTGAYRVVVMTKDGKTAESAKMVSVYPSESGKPDFRVTVDAPETIRSSRWYEMVVVVENIGNADGASPIISVNGQNLTFKDPDGSQLEYESVIHLLGTSQQGDPLVISAGEVVQIPIMFRQSATASSGGTVVANAISREDVHWGVFIGKSNMSDDEWNAFSAAYKEGFADAGAFLDAVYAKAALVSSVGRPPVNAYRLYDFVQRKKRGEVLGIVAGVVLDADGSVKPGQQFTIGALGSASPCVGVTAGSYGTFVQYAVPTGLLVTVSDAGIITSEKDYELEDSPLDGCIFTWHEGNDVDSEEVEMVGKIARLLRLPLEEPTWLWMDNAALMAGVPKSISETVILDGLGGGTYRVCPISATECLLALLMPIDGTNTLVACRLRVSSAGTSVEVGAAAHIAEDVFSFASMSAADESSFSVVYSRQEAETGDKTYFKKTVSFADIPQVEEYNASSLLSVGSGRRLMATSPDYGEETFPQISIGTFKIPFHIGVWPIQATDTGLEETGCCIWQREASSGLAGGFSLGDKKTFAKKPNKPGWVPGLVVSGKTTSKDTYWCHKRKFGTGDCSEEHKSMHSSSYTMSAKAIVSAELELAQAMPEFPIGKFGSFGIEVSASAKGSLTFVRDLTKGFVTWPSNGQVITRDIDRNTYGVQGKFTVSGDVKFKGESEWQKIIRGPAGPYSFVMICGEKRTLGGEVPLASISGSIWLEYHHDWDKTGGKSYHSNTASYGADIELAPFFSLTGSKQWRNGKVTGGWKRRWRLNPFDDNNWRETTKNGDTTLLPWTGLENSEGEHHSGPKLLSLASSPDTVASVAADIRIDETHALSVSSAIPCEMGSYGDAVVCRDYEYNGQKWHGAFVYRSGMAAGRLNEDGENVSSVQVVSHTDGTVRVFYLAATPVLDESDEDATFKSCVIKALYCRTLKNGVWLRRERISEVGNVTVENFALSEASATGGVAVIWEEINANDTGDSMLCCSMFASSADASLVEYGKILALDDNQVVAAYVSVVGDNPVVDYAKRLSDGTDELHSLTHDVSNGWTDSPVIGVQSTSAAEAHSLLNASIADETQSVSSTSARQSVTALRLQSSGWVVTDDCDRGCNCGCGEYRQTPPPGCICKAGCKLCRQDCGSYCYCGYKKSFKKVTSYDPNEMVGPVGVGEERYVKPGELMDYTIYFENQTNATAAAQDVYVTLPKDAGLDWNTFRLGEVVFGDNIDTTLSGFHEGESTYALPGTNWSVRTEVTHTADAVKWHLRIIDPTTSDNYPADPYVGFLPPNDPETHCGEGHLRFSVNVKEDAMPGAIIKASAVIEFDPLNGNKPIETDPAWSNTVAQVQKVEIHDGEGGVITQDLIVGMPYGELPTPAAREGLTFGGWWTAPGGPNGAGRRVTAESLVQSGDSGLYEYWLVNAYTVRFNANGGEGLMSSQAFEFDKPDALDSNAFTRTSHRFLGWATNETGEAVYEDGAVVSNLTTVANGTVELFAAWELTTMEVSFDLNYADAQQRVPPMVVTNGMAYGALPVVEREGYTFDGWVNALAARSTWVTAETIVTNEADHTLYAQWTVNQYAITIDLGGGTGETGATLAYGKRVGDIPLPSRVGYAFDGWWTAAEGGELIPGDALITGDLSLHARWLANAYTVVFHSGHDGEDFVVSQAFVMDEAKALTSNGFARAGHSFAGWATNETGAAVYADGAVVSNLTTESGGVVDFHATWTINSYAVTFDANGGEGGWSSNMVYGAAIAAPAVTREGYTFAGWQPALLGTVPANDVTFTAQWEISEIVKPDPGPEPDPEPVAEETPRLWTEVTGAAPSAATTYEGYLYDASGNVKGTIQVKVGKPNKKTGLAAVKATVIGTDGKKKTLKAAEKGKAKIAGDGPTTIPLAGGDACEVILGAKGMGGTYGAHVIDGSLNVFASKDAADKAVAAATLAQWKGAVNVAWRPDATERVPPYHTLSVTIAAKGKAKVAGTLADGTKVSAKGQLIVGEAWCCVPVVVSKKAKLAFAVWLPVDATERVPPVVVGIEDAIVGKPGTLKAGAAFRLGGEMGDAKYGAYLPNGVAVSGGAKWTLPKAGKVVYAKGTTMVDEAKAGENPSALKLTYKAKDGTFKGSFKAYADVGGKPKGTTVKVTGVLVGGVGYGTATAKGSGGVAVTVE